MTYTEQDIENAIVILESRGLAPIVRHYDGYIILAQSENDFKSKVYAIQSGDILGFYTVKDFVERSEQPDL